MEHILFIKERFHVGGVNHAETIYYLSHDDGCRWPHRLLYDTPSTVSGRVTAQLEMAQGGSFSPSDGFSYGKEDFRFGKNL